MSDYALEVREHERRSKRRRKGEERKNQPPALRDAAMDKEIRAAIERGLSLAEAESAVLAWNAGQPSPAGKAATKRRIFDAYKAARLVGGATNGTSSAEQAQDAIQPSA